MVQPTNPTKRGLKLRHLVSNFEAARHASTLDSYPWGDIRSTLTESVECSYRFVGDEYFKGGK